MQPLPTENEENKSISIDSGNFPGAGVRIEESTINGANSLRNRNSIKNYLKRIINFFQKYFCSSKIELIHYLICFVNLVAIEVVGFAGGIPRIVNFYKNLSSYELKMLILFCALIVHTSWVCHEFAHKVSAIILKLEAEFRMYWLGLLTIWASALSGLFFASAAGAVIIKNANNEKAGKTAVAGPIVNSAFGVIFLLIFILIEAKAFDAQWIVRQGIFQLFSVNLISAAFNMIPFSILDGLKVQNWNKKIFWIMIIPNAVLAIGSIIYAKKFL